MSDKTSDKRLKRCPFCGGEAEITTRSVYMWEHIVVCKECGASSKPTGGIAPSQARIKAIKSWNTRKPVDDVVEALKEKAYYLEETEYHHGMIVVDLDDAIEIVKEHLT